MHMTYPKQLAFVSAIGCILLLSTLSPTHAAPPTSSSTVQTDRILQQQLEQERRRRREEEREEQQRSRPSPAPTTAPPAGVPEGECTPISSIEFNGVTLLAEKQIAALKAPYLDTCMSVVDIKALMQDVTNEYLEMGYVSFPRALRGNRTVARLRRLSETSTWEFLPAGAREPEPMIVLPRHSPRK